jgi:hypothetical protein
MYVSTVYQPSITANNTNNNISSYADGTHEVVCQRVTPVIPKLRPALDAQSQAAIIGAPLPTIIDISKYGTPNLREVPKWRPKSDFLIVSSMSPDHSCHHGACRLREM